MSKLSNKEQLVLLENILDSLDRLFDGESQVVDIHSVLFATSVALAETCHFQIIESTTKRLETILQTKFSETELRESALLETNELRIYIAENVPMLR